MYPNLPLIGRSWPLRLLAAIAWWMLALPIFTANVPMTAAAGTMQAMHAVGTTMHRSVSSCDVLNTQTSCCPDHHHSTHHPGFTCHCPASCTGLISSVKYDAALAFASYTNGIMFAAADAPSPIASPPLRPPAI